MDYKGKESTKSNGTTIRELEKQNAVLQRRCQHLSNKLEIVVLRELFAAVKYNLPNVSPLEKE